VITVACVARMFTVLTQVMVGVRLVRGLVSVIVSVGHVVLTRATIGRRTITRYLVMCFMVVGRTHRDGLSSRSRLHP